MKPLAISVDNEFRTVALKTLMLAIALLFAGFVSNASAKGVSTRLDTEANIQPGNYSVVAYGCNGSADPRAVAFLQRDDVPYHVSVAEPRAQVQTVSGLTADEAYRRAEDFLTACDASVQKGRLSRIVAPDGTLVGYELKPVFIPLHAGSTDGVYTSYRMKGDTIQAKVTLDQLLQLNQMGGG